MDNSDPLERFVEAQNREGTYVRALAELRAGRKTGHWMWFVFPQVRGLGQSATSRTYAIGSLEEAETYMAHPVLGPRLLECTSALLSAAAASAEEILGPIDAMKLRSSMTLFARAAPDRPEFRQLLDVFFAGEPDPLTERILGPEGSGRS
jgi:uncharacterized protein (DUF1810 family)